MRRLKLVLLVASLTALLTAGLAVAKRGDRTHTDTNGASFTLNRTGQFKEATCTGEDGQYREFRATYTGTATSPDPRLAGALTVRARGLINTTDDRGTVTGRWMLRNADGKRAAGGALFSVYRVGMVYGVLVGSVRDRAGHPVEEMRGSGILIANFQATFPAAATTITGAFGGVGADNRRPAAIQGGGCDNGTRARGNGRKSR